MAKNIVTLKSALESHNIESLAEKLADMADRDGIKKMGLTFSLAVKRAQDISKERAVLQAKLKEEAAERRRQSLISTVAARNEARTAEMEKELQARKEEAEAMIQNMIETMGFDLEVAQEMVNVAMQKKYNDNSKSFTFNRTAVHFNGKTYNMGVTGNMPDVLKEAVANSGLSRADFIREYAIDKDDAERIIVLKNGVN